MDSLINRTGPQHPARFAISDVTRRYYVVWLFYAFGGGFVYAVYPLFLRSRGLSQLQANSLVAMFFLVTFLTDVPTGAFADALSRRTAFLVSCVLHTLAFTLYFLSHHYFLFLLAESVDAIGATFGNGAIDAWAVDALDTAGFTGLKGRLFSRVSQLTNTGWLLSAMAGAYVADIGISWPWILGALGYLLTLFVGGLLMRGEPARAFPELHRLMGEIAGRVRTGVHEGFHSRPILLLTLASAINLGAWTPYYMEWPQYFHKNLGLGIWVIGWLYCFFSIGRLVGAELIARIEPGGGARASLLAGLALVCAAMLLGAARGGGVPATLGMLFALNVCSGAMQPVAQSWINEHLEARNRATLLSFQSTFATLGGCLGLLLCGWVADRDGALASWTVAGLIALGSPIIYWKLRIEKVHAQVVSRAVAASAGELSDKVG